MTPWRGMLLSLNKRSENRWVEILLNVSSKLRKRVCLSQYCPILSPLGYCTGTEGNNFSSTGFVTLRFESVFFTSKNYDNITWFIFTSFSSHPNYFSNVHKELVWSLSVQVWNRSKLSEFRGQNQHMLNKLPLDRKHPTNQIKASNRACSNKSKQIWMTQ